MDERIILALLAIVAGVAVGIALFVPFVAVAYRRGGLTFWRVALWSAALVYFFAIWTFTLLPLPDPDAITCVGAVLDPLAFIDDVRGAIARPGSTLTDPAVLQLVFNVLLFIPLGFFVRVLVGRGVVVALLVGLAVSLFIELTQLTGVWGIYPCAYRFFDVDDVLTNTLGAVIGSLLSLVVPKRHRGWARSPDADDPAPVTRTRRLLAMVCDLLGALLTQSAVGVGVQLTLQLIGRRDLVLDGSVASAVGTAAPAVVWLVVVLATGRTIGDLAVELRYAGGPLPAWAARPLRYLGGIGGFLVLGMLPQPWTATCWVLALAGFVAVFVTEHGRGLPGVLSGQRLRDAREAITRASVGPG